MKRRPLAWLGFTVIAWLFALVVVDACTIVNGLVVDIGEGGTSAGADASDAGGDGDVDPCMHTRPPAPAPSDPSVLDDGSEVFAVVARQVSFGFQDGGGLEAIGYDLDKQCTCFGAPPTGSCKAYAPDATICDNGGGGQDNAAQTLLQQARDIGKLDFEKETNQSVDAGGRSVLIWVSGYNGKPDDKKVEVAVLVSPGLFDEGTGDPMSPTFTLADNWSVDKSAAVDGSGTTIPNLKSQVAGYVVDHTLVVLALDVALPITQVATVSFNQAVFVAKIIDGPVAGTHTLSEARFAGRWSITEAARVVGSFEPKVDAGRICDLPDQSIYKFLKSGICQAADLRTQSAEDGHNLPCDAVSIAVKMEAAPATLGKTRTVDVTGYCTSTPPIDCMADGGP